MSPVIPAGRIQLARRAADAYRAMSGLSQTVTLDPRLRLLLEIRASQLNGCAFCVDMHWKDARAAGETEERLAMVAVWPETPLFDDRERAALALTEEITLLDDRRVSDKTWEEANRRFDEAELAQVVFAATVINAWNRLSITSRLEPGHYRPGMLG